MSQTPIHDWLYDKPRRPRGGGFWKLLLAVAVVGGGAWWAGTASPWADAVQQSPVGQQVLALEDQFAHTPVGRWLGDVWALGTSGKRLARLAPANTAVYAEAAPSWWTRFVMYGLKMQPSGPSVDEARDWLHREWDVDWDKDVAPWFEPDIGLLGVPAGQNGFSWSVWIGSHDQGRAEAFVTTLRDRRVAAGYTAQTLTHGQTTIQALTSPEGTTTALAVLGGYVVAASPAGAIDGLIDQVDAPKTTLALDNPRYRRIESASPHGALGQAFWDFGDRAGARQGGWPRPPGFAGPICSAAGASLTGGGDWMTVSVTTAFETDEATDAMRERWAQFMPPLDMSRFDRLPDATVLAVGGTASPQLSQWLPGATTLGWAPLGGGFGEGWAFGGLLSGLKTMKGPFAAGLVATGPDAEARNPVGAVLSVRPENPAALTDELERTATAIAGVQDPSHLPAPLSNWAANPWVQRFLPGVTQLDEETHGRDTWKVLRAAGQPLAGWRASGDDVVLAGGAEALRLCQDDRFASLSRASGFADVRKRLPANPGLFVYADGPNVVHLFEASPWIPAKYVAEAKRALKPLRAIGAAAEPGIDQQGFHHAAFTVLATP